MFTIVAIAAAIGTTEMPIEVLNHFDQKLTLRELEACERLKQLNSCMLQYRSPQQPLQRTSMPQLLHSDCAAITWLSRVRQAR